MWLELTCSPQTQRAELGLEGEKCKDCEERTWLKPEQPRKERGSFRRVFLAPRGPSKQIRGCTRSGLLPRKCQDFVILSHPFVLSKIFFWNVSVCTEGSAGALQNPE